MVGIVGDQDSVFLKLADPAPCVEDEGDRARLAGGDRAAALRLDTSAGRAQLARDQIALAGVFDFKLCLCHRALDDVSKVDFGLGEAQVGCLGPVLGAESLCDVCADVDALHRAVGIVGGEEDVVEGKSPILFEACNVGDTERERVARRQCRLAQAWLEVGGRLAARLADLYRLAALVIENGRLRDGVVLVNAAVCEVVGAHPQIAFLKRVEIDRPLGAWRDLAMDREADVGWAAIGFYEDFLCKNAGSPHRVVLDLDKSAGPGHHGVPAPDGSGAAASGFDREQLYGFAARVLKCKNGACQSSLLLDFPKIKPGLFKLGSSLGEAELHEEEQQEQHSQPPQKQTVVHHQSNQSFHAKDKDFQNCNESRSNTK